jgi:hypothetical protein
VLFEQLPSSPVGPPLQQLSQLMYWYTCWHMHTMSASAARCTQVTASLRELTLSSRSCTVGCCIIADAVFLWLCLHLQETPSDVSVEVIPRSREVGQSYITSVFTTLYSLLFAARMVLRHRPQLVSSAGQLRQLQAGYRPCQRCNLRELGHGRTKLACMSAASNCCLHNTLQINQQPIGQLLVSCCSRHHPAKHAASVMLLWLNIGKQCLCFGCACCRCL